jgi:hypothetical protein
MWEILPVESTCLAALRSEVEAVSGFHPARFVSPSCHTGRPRIRRLFPSTLPLLSQADRDAKLLRESEAIVHVQTCWLQGLPNERDVAKELSS